MDKKEAKKLGAWISLLGGLCFVLGGLSAIYIAFYMTPDTATKILMKISRFLHPH